MNDRSGDVLDVVDVCVIQRSFSRVDPNLHYQSVIARSLKSVIQT
jgi:hypothetical protein